MEVGEGGQVRRGDGGAFTGSEDQSGLWSHHVRAGYK